MMSGWGVLARSAEGLMQSYSAQGEVLVTQFKKLWLVVKGRKMSMTTEVIIAVECRHKENKAV